MSIGIIDSDPIAWIRNKLGSDDLWNYGNVASLITTDILSGIEEQFHSLEIKIKLKLLLSFLQIPRRNIDNFKNDLSGIILNAEQDEDDWVKVVASMLKDYPKTAMVHTDLTEESATFRQTVKDIGISVENCTSGGTLPMECPYLNRTALTHLVGQQQGPTKHFTLRRKPKSAALRAQLTQRASEIASHKKTVSNISNSSSHHSGSRRSLSGGAPCKESKNPTISPAKNHSSRSSQVLPPVRSSLRAPSASMKKTKLLDITEQPVAGRESKKKRKAQETEASVAESKISKNTEQHTNIVNQQPDESIQEDVTETPKEGELKTKEAEKEKEIKQELSAPTSPPATPSYAVLPGSTQATYVPPVPSGQGDKLSGVLHIDPNATTASKSLQRELQIRVRQQQLMQQQQQQQQQQQEQQQQQPSQLTGDNQQAVQFRQLPPIAQELNPSLRNGQLTVPTLNPFGHTGAHLKHYRIQGSPAGQPLPTPSNAAPQQPTSAPASAPTPAPAPSPAPAPTVPRPNIGGKSKLSLTREQMLAAQEMFRSANKVTRAEKALILGFMAGGRENRFPQQGPVITIKLSEEKTNMTQPDGTSQMVLVEMLFEMNYDTGHWRRLKRTRVLAPALAEEPAAGQF